MSHHIFFASFLVPPYTVTTSDISPVRGLRPSICSMNY